MAPAWRSRRWLAGPRTARDDIDVRIELFGVLHGQRRRGLAAEGYGQRTRLGDAGLLQDGRQSSVAVDAGVAGGAGALEDKGVVLDDDEGQLAAAEAAGQAGAGAAEAADDHVAAHVQLGLARGLAAVGEA